VENREDGTVEAVFEGEKENINEMLEWCKKGPAIARVDEVKAKNEEPEIIERFEIRR